MQFGDSYFKDNVKFPPPLKFAELKPQDLK
jgi:hypothetical protein